MESGDICPSCKCDAMCDDPDNTGTWLKCPECGWAEAINKTQKPEVSPSKSTELLCADCGQIAPVPFDCGDGKVRCAACAVDTYMKRPYRTATEMIIRPYGLTTDGTITPEVRRKRQLERR